MRALIILILIAVGLGSLWAYWAGHGIQIYEWWVPGHSNTALSDVSDWGDSFGALNALVSGLGLSAVLATLWLQSVALKDQARDLHKQRFESSFFELLRLLREVRAELIFRHSADYRKAIHKDAPSVILPLGSNVQGLDAINAAVRELRYWLAPGRSDNRAQSTMVEIYGELIHKNNEASFGPYFRLVYTLLNRLRCDEILSENEKAQYGNLLRSQLTSEEITLIGVNALAPFANDLQSLLIEFRMLKYLPVSSMQRRFKRTYDPIAFASRD